MDPHAFPAIDLLVSIFMDDKQLAPLYREGILESCISPSRFIQDFRLLKRFAVRLKEESHNAVDVDVANLVASRADLLAARIGNKYEQQCFQLGRFSTQPQGMEVKSEAQADLNNDFHNINSEEKYENEPEPAKSFGINRRS